MQPLMSITRVTAIAALVIGLVGCGSRPAPTTQVVVPNSMAFMASPRFDDLDPHDWVDSHPVNYPVHGIDVARYQGDIDWHQARASGVAFAYIKATEGGDYLDPMFDNHRKGARRAGVRQGAYHYYYFCRPAEEQARWFIENVPREWNSLPHVLDMEWNHRSPTCRLRPDDRTVRAEAAKFLNILENHYGKRRTVVGHPVLAKVSRRSSARRLSRPALGVLAIYRHWCCAGHQRPRGYQRFCRQRRCLAQLGKLSLAAPTGWSGSRP